MIQVGIDAQGVKGIYIHAGSASEEKSLYRIIPVIRRHLDKLEKDLCAEAAAKDYFRYLWGKVKK